MGAPGNITGTNAKWSGDRELAGASAKEPAGAADSRQPPGAQDRPREGRESI